MNGIKVQNIALTASLGFHAAMGIAMAGLSQWACAQERPSDTVIISYIRAVPPSVNKTAVSAPIPAQKPVTKTLPAVKSDLVPAKKAPVDPVRTRQRLALRRLARASRVEQPRVAEIPKTGADFITDPQRGSLYINYFGIVKEKIHKTLRRKYAKRQLSGGQVSLWFVLESSGRLVQASVNAKESSAGAFLQDFALEALKASSPFGPFPKQLSSDQIAFTVNVFFDEL